MTNMKHIYVCRIINITKIVQNYHKYCILHKTVISYLTSDNIEIDWNYLSKRNEYVLFFIWVFSVSQSNFYLANGFSNTF